MKKTMLLLFALMLSSAICAQDYHVVLWDNTTAPTSNGLSGDEVESKPGQWKNTQTAEMWIYKAGDNATGQALVFFPGGGYSSLSVGNGHKEAQWFARNGITAAVVKYRLPNGHSEVPRNDADEALRVMRSMAAELNIDPAKVGVSGTSAGGYLAGSVGTLSDVKPGFMILFYPVISADPDKRHKGTFVQLLGAEDADKPLAQEFSLEKKVDAATPPTLLFHCDDDKVVPAVNSALFYQKLKEHGVKADVIIGAKTRDMLIYTDAMRAVSLAISALSASSVLPSLSTAILVLSLTSRCALLALVTVSFFSSLVTMKTLLASVSEARSRSKKNTREPSDDSWNSPGAMRSMSLRCS